jgi:E3 ubiquitin-protein ligase UBR7
LVKNSGEDEAEIFTSAPTTSSDADRNGSIASLKRKAELESPELVESLDLKRRKANEEPKTLHHFLPSAPKKTFSLFLRENFRDHLCRCAECYPLLRAHPQLLDEEILYEPPLSEPGDENGESIGTGSLLDRGEAALSNVDRVRAIGKSHTPLPPSYPTRPSP